MQRPPAACWTEQIIKKIRDVGLKVHVQLLSNDEGVDGFCWPAAELVAVRAEMDDMLDQYPQTMISSRYYHKVITTGDMLGRRFGWSECPSVTEPIDRRKNYSGFRDTPSPRGGVE